MGASEGRMVQGRGVPKAPCGTLKKSGAYWGGGRELPLLHLKDSITISGAFAIGE